MLPKVANQIIHHTSRAVLAVQNQTGQTIRNVLQIHSSAGPPTAVGPWNNSGSSSSGWGNSGPGAGGAKQQSSSSRFHSSHAGTGVGRAATLVDPAISHGQNADSFDDPDELILAPPLRARRRQQTRSSSLSTRNAADEQYTKVGVLKTVQLHVRARHAFASPAIASSTPEGLLQGREHEIALDIEDEDLAVDALQDGSSRSAADDALFEALQVARDNGDAAAVVREVEKIRQMTPPPSSAVFNAALASMSATRRHGEPLKEILALYHDMVNRSVVPNFRTYLVLIEILTTREAEVADTIYFYEARIQRRRTTSPDADNSADQQQIARLRTENNFSSALTLFQAACSIAPNKIPAAVYNNLMRCCAIHGNVDAAIHVYAHLEKRSDVIPHPNIFRDLIRVYQTANDLQGAREVFEEFKSAAQSGRLSLGDSEQDGVVTWRKSVLSVWNEMIEVYFRCGQPASALGLLEQMMDSPATVDFEVGDVPLPGSSTFSRIIKGFLLSGDIPSALTWFDRLLMQSEKPVNPYKSLASPTRPDELAWNLIVESLITNNRFEDLERILKTGEQHEGEVSNRLLLDTIKTFTTHCLLDPTLNGPQVLSALEQLRRMARRPMLDWVSWDVLSPLFLSWKTYFFLQQLYISCGALDRAFDALDECVRSGMTALNDAESRGVISLKDLESRRQSLRHAVQVFTRTVTEKASTSQWTLKNMLRLNELTRFFSCASSPEYLALTLKMFADAPTGEKDALTPDDWSVLLLIARALNNHNTAQKVPIEPAVSLTDLIGAAARRGILAKIDMWILRLLSQSVGEKNMARFITLAGEAGFKGDSLKVISGQGNWNLKHNAGALSPSIREQLEEIPAKLTFDPSHSRFIDEHVGHGSSVTPLIAFGRFEAGCAKGKYPTPDTLARLIAALGRLGETDKVATLYDAAQTVLASLKKKPEWQAAGWFEVENAMIIALAHSGDVDGAHQHRARVLEQGGTPSSDAYGALIQCVKDTTDDTSNAMALFNEAISRGIMPNIYLYNTAISKLAKARKADHALALFQEMKGRGIRPTSVTYGAVIAACCRVGDAQSAEVLFNEMASQPNFKPRVPPYNTMMQLYTHTKPDRERVLHFYNAMLAAHVQPTAHTYKLLIDAYGTIEPVDVDAMQQTFDTMVADRRVEVQGTHWAALINAWGCVRKDLDKAISIFESIRTHPASRNPRSPLPDAVVFEALMNVLVTVRRADLIPAYLEKMESCGVHMTAYIANLVIKGFAAADEIEKSREIFESLVDPPEGVAAPGNHASHDNTPMSNGTVPAGAPVYREPSTWEAMVRAELGNGNRDQAVKLLERVQARRFPAAVYGRISGIMLDDSVSPWSPSAPWALTPESTMSLNYSDSSSTSS